MTCTVHCFNWVLDPCTGKATTAAAAAAAAATRQQEDAQEFLNFLLDSAHQELLHLRLLHAASLGNPGAHLI